MKKFKYLDYFIVVPYVILCVFGIIMVYSSSADYYIINGIRATSYLFRQMAYVMVGFLVAALVFELKLKKFRSSTFLKIFAIGMIFSFVYLLFWGSVVNGAKGWIELGPINIQPAEVAKLFLTLYLADMLSKHNDRLERDPKSYYRAPLIMTLVFVLAIFLQRDLGGATINFTIALIIFFASGIDYRKGIGIILLGVSAFMFVLLPLASRINVNTKNYMLQRIVGFAHPFELAKSSGNQLVNSYYAIGNGGVFGVGLGNSIQKKGYLPEANTDFIMAVVSEELGLVTVSLILILLLVIVGRAIWLGIHAHNMYETLVCYGLATYLSIQTFFNIGGVTGLLPITGVTFPFISYGGSSMLVLSVAMGILLNVSANVQRERTKNLTLVRE
ncbi:FtsW/RodA/SpoVE family cell cycle protein [Pediococcus parvulus]|uniref:FtsW/RodA/SpoVE family cell cycle protein n=1 Tax=Pediococcus parvulus TaxID=54062 RepID=UPI000B103F6B|nr:FtsW/RodA/SpoVE family cell cycle protein [Pediococcus parvulus]MCT3027149.1 FtsW/RodA/SpoVE family cell cycle protein [Pediococcus parvulus]GEL89979.1 cell division protein FtsW [Pediococcus parvulus]GHC08516.1 cell division protein FtsW [Pediococcus parvulus]